MLNARETEIILDNFFRDCFNFWAGQGCDERKSFENALADVRNLKHDPYEPCGKELDAKTKEEFILYKEMDLG